MFRFRNDAGLFNLRKVALRDRIVRFQSKDSGKSVLSLLETSSITQCQSQVKHSVNKMRVNAQGALEFRDRLLKQALCIISDSQVITYVGVVGIEGQRLLIFADRIRVKSAPVQIIAK